MDGVLRGVFGYCFLVFMVRLVGRRPGKQMTPFDFVLIFFMGGLALTPMVGDDRSIINALCIITSIAGTHFAITALKRRFETFSKIVDGTPLLLLEKGQWHTEAMNNCRIMEEDVMALARDNQLRSLKEVDYAILERNGQISIIKHSEK